MGVGGDDTGDDVDDVVDDVVDDDVASDEGGIDWIELIDWVDFKSGKGEGGEGRGRQRDLPTAADTL